MQLPDLLVMFVSALGASTDALNNVVQHAYWASLAPLEKFCRFIKLFIKATTWSSLTEG